MTESDVYRKKAYSYEEVESIIQDMLKRGEDSFEVYFIISNVPMESYDPVAEVQYGIAVEWEEKYGYRVMVTHNAIDAVIISFRK